MKTTAGTPLLAVNGLTVEFPTTEGWLPVVEDVSFEVGHGETIGLVGESGSGKTVSSLAVLGLVGHQGGRITKGSIRFDGHELVGSSQREMRHRRGKEISMIFQQAVRSLNPAYTVGDQIGETLRRHLGMSRRAARQRSIELLDRVHIPDAARRVRDYPHMFSGGMLQRVMIAVAVACEPKLLFADEPTTALDVSVQATVLELLEDLQRDTGISIVFISHDLAVIAEICDRVVVMYAGQVVEQGSAEELFVHPEHPYTAGLLGSIPRLGATRRLVAIPGTVPPPGSNVSGCRFHPRCPYAMARCCEDTVPALVQLTDTASSRCLRTAEITLDGITIEAITPEGVGVP